MLAHGVTPPWAKTEPIGPSGHHLIFDSFHRTAPYNDDRYHFNFMGARIAHELERDLIEVVPGFNPDLASGIKASGRSARYGDDPTFPYQNSEDYFEWIDLLTAIERSRTQFTMIEVGAGYGRWISNAAATLKRRKKVELLRPKLVALEANKARFDSMVRNCEQNEIPGSELTLLRAACTPDGSPVFMICNDDYGASVTRNDDVMRMFVAFAKEDPNGTGTHDTFGVDQLRSQFWNAMFRVPYNWRLNSDGSLTKDVETEEWKAALNFANTMWNKGVFHPDALTLTLNQSARPR